MAGFCPGIRTDVTPSEIVACVRRQIDQQICCYDSALSV
jgi:hypothetical protein